MRYTTFHESLKNAVLTPPGATPESLGRAVLERARQGRPSQDDVPPALSRYVDTVARHAYKVTDAGVAELQQAGNSDDALFEITVAAAVRSEEHTSELQSLRHLVCRLLLEKKKKRQSSTLKEHGAST